jgi:hypothetical protein
VSTLKEQFEAREALKPKPKWIYGDRVYGKLDKIPVIGMVIREDYEDSSIVLCHLDLPVKIETEYRWIVRVPSKGMKRLKVIYEAD